MSQKMLSEDLGVDWAAVAALVDEQAQECGVFNDVNLAGTEEPEVPNAPFEEFPRLATMDDAELEVVVAVAERYVDLHHAAVSADDAEPGERAPGGMYSIIAQARALASSIVLLKAPSGAQVSLRPNDHGVVVVFATSTDPTNEAYGYIDVNLASPDACAGRAVAFVDQEGPSTLVVWDRDGLTWRARDLDDERYTAERIGDELAGLLAPIRLPPD